MENSIKSRRYWIKLLPAIGWQAAYLVVCGSFGKDTRVWCDLVFYLGIAVWFTTWRDWSLSGWKNSAEKGKSFWIPVVLTTLGMAAMFAASSGLSALFPNVDDGMGVFGVDGWPTLVAFALTTILLPPIAEELFYRKAVTSFDTKTVLVVTTIISVLLYASEHSLSPLGFAQACLWAIPLSVAYITTKNVYIPMTAHLICNLAFNGTTVVMTAISLAN